MKGIPVKTGSKKTKPFSIVAIGASAGGLEALIELLKGLPKETGMAYVYIQHMNPDHESHLSEILGRITTMPVQEAMENVTIRPNQLYIIPPNREMVIADGTLKLSARPTKPLSHMPINQFFNSLAEHSMEKAIGILLSGNPPDGTLGLKAIKAMGGITFAQDGSARFGGMPRNAVAEEVVDLMLPPKRIAEELIKLSQQQEKYQEALLELNDSGTEGKDENLTHILKHIQRLTGADFSHYKLNTLRRRIIRRMILHKMESLKQYLDYIRQPNNEGHQLYQDFLINVTSFFRDQETSDYLKKTLLPKLIKQKPQGEPIRIWVPACSTGQEPYSLAMLILEVLGDKAATTKVQIFATDLSEVAINKARLGIYSKDEVVDIPQRRLDRFFNKIDGSYRIIKSIRDLCVFATHNVLRDPPFSRLDIISCCNLLIYLELVLQKKIMATFHYSLNNTGYLILGKSETIGAAGHLFNQIEKKHKIYAKKKDAAAKALFELTFRTVDQEKERDFERKFVPAKNKAEDLDLEKMIDQVLLKKYTPACVVVNQDLDIIQFRGSTGIFMEPSPGKASLNLLKMARAGLGLELRNIVFKANKSGKPEEKSWVETFQDKTKKLTVEALPLKQETESNEKYFLVTFEEVFAINQEKAGAASKDKRVKELEAELMALREDMRSIVEEQEAANEELQSANEEVVSSNEELQSINEELETSKEELESSNEELITINQELQMRNEQLAEVQEYSEAVFTTIRESLLILDKNFRVKNANKTFYKTFGISEEEAEGRLLYDLADRQWNLSRMRKLLEDIVADNGQVNDFEIRHEFPGIGEKVLLVNARKVIRKLHSEHLILLAIEDITEHRKSQELIAEREQLFRSMAENLPMMVWVSDRDKRMQYVNRAWLDFRDAVAGDVIGKSWLEEMAPADEKRVKKVFDESYATRKSFSVQYQVIQGTRSRTVLTMGQPNYGQDGSFIGFIGSCVALPEAMESTS